MIRAVLFDMDGVLIDACGIHRDAFRRACAEHGVCVTSEQERSLEGLPTRVKLSMLNVSAETANAVAKAKQEYTAIQADAYAPDSDKVYLLTALRDLGLRIGVYSNAVHDSVERFLTAAGLRSFVEAINTNENVAQPKPDPEGYLSLMRHFGVTPNETLIVEDAPVGRVAARRSGAWVCEVAGPHEVTLNRILATLEMIPHGR